MVPAPFTVVVSCEHATNAVPAGIDLGISPEVLDSHVAWDPGAATVAGLLARELGAPLHLGEHTRLVADLNRSPWNPEIVPLIAFDQPIPGNQTLDEAGRRQRVERFHRPFWERVRREIEGILDADPEARVLHLSIHSFTGEFRGRVRPMSVGVMIDPAKPLEREACDVLLQQLASRGVRAAENEPYDGRADALVTGMRPRFGPERYAGVEFELSQNHLPEIRPLGQALLDSLRALPLRS